MKFKLIFLVTLLALVSLSTARPQDEYVDEESSPPPKKPARPLIGRRNPLAGKVGAKTATTTTTTTAAPQEEEVVDESEYVDEEQAPVETSSTTESSKKLKGGVVRPFRSNDDLLASLKKRREQAVHGKPAPKQAVVEKQDEAASEVQKESKPAPSQAASGGRRNRFNKAKSTATEAETSSTAAPARTGRRFGRR